MSAVTAKREQVTQGCPKRMEFGPCGGVKVDGQCEMRPGPCMFTATVPWSGPEVDAPPVASPPLVLADFSCAPFDAADAQRVAAVLGPACDAVLVGDHQNRPGFPPTLMGRLLLDSGRWPDDRPGEYTRSSPNEPSWGRCFRCRRSEPAVSGAPANCTRTQGASTSPVTMPGLCKHLK